MKNLEIMSLEKFTSVGNIRDIVNKWIDDIEFNNKNPYEIPLYINEDYHKYPIKGAALSFGGCISCNLSFDKSDEIKIVAPDSRPYVGGEYWSSRGPSEYDCSGFVKSKLAGERLLRLVKFVLETDEPKSFLDYREREPTWIQFKFRAEEFDLEKLDKLSCENDGILNEQILRKCINSKNNNKQ